VFPRPDDPFAEPSDQLAALYQEGLWNVYDYLLANDPGSAYTYVYRGQAQTLDQLFLSPALRRRMSDAWVPHLNSDWPAGVITEGRFGASDHEPVVAAFRF
jgi:predicted extracellular nuclease